MPLPPTKPSVFTHEAMSTTFEFRVRHAEPGYARQAAQAAFAEIDRLETLLSRFHEGSDIWRINHAAAGERVVISEECHACLLEALRVHELTGGAFDATLGAAADLVKSAGKRQAVPEPGALQDLLDRRAASTIALSPGGFVVEVTRPGASLDLGAIGKGFALDAAAALLREWEIEHALLGAGGSSILAMGAEAGADGAGDAPGVDDVPRAGGASGESDRSATPETPGASAALATSAAPGTPDTPAAFGASAASAAPGASSALAASAAPGAPRAPAALGAPGAADASGAGGWVVNLLGEIRSARLVLHDCALGASGTGGQGNHIIDPRRRSQAYAHIRAWALAPAAAAADALSTAWMTMTADEIASVLASLSTGHAAVVEHPDGSLHRIDPAGPWTTLAAPAPPLRHPAHPAPPSATRRHPAHPAHSGLFLGKPRPLRATPPRHHPAPLDSTRIKSN